MKVTIFSGNQARHLNLAKTISSIAEEVFFISECTTIFPGEIEDFYKKTEIMQKYFQRVIKAEKKIFGDIDFLPKNVSSLLIKNRDLSNLSKKQLSKALFSDVYIIFGASYIRGWLIEFLLKNNAINIHMGLSPYYRGNSCNFWALYDNNPSYVGATIHKISKGLDNGPIIFHCVPKLQKTDNIFDFAMRSVLSAHKGIVSFLKQEQHKNYKIISQDKLLEIRYSVNKDFSDEVAEKFLNRNTDIQKASFEYPELKNLFIH